MRPPKPRPVPPRPELVRRPRGRSFGWLETHLLHDGWLSRLAPDATAVLVLLALAADERGSSFYGRERMGGMLGLDRERIDRALARLLELGLVAHRPWSAGNLDGVWQLLPVVRVVRRASSAEAVGDILGQLGLKRPSN